MSVAIVGMDEEAHIDENVRLAQNFEALGPGELDMLVQEARELIHNDKPSDSSPIFWLYDIKSMAWQEESEPVTVAY